MLRKGSRGGAGIILPEVRARTSFGELQLPARRRPRRKVVKKMTCHGQGPNLRPSNNASNEPTDATNWAIPSSASWAIYICVFYVGASVSTASSHDDECETLFFCLFGITYVILWAGNWAVIAYILSEGTKSLRRSPSLWMKEISVHSRAHFLC